MIDRRTFLASGALLASQTILAQPASALLADAPRPIVRTRNGAVAGIASGPVNIFRGIPYAKPPVGPLRFRPTRPVADWRETLDASKFGPGGIQTAPIASGTAEDCLTLNIWAPIERGPHPVLFWIHGGGNALGSAGRYDGTPFARQGIVFVSVNYRLGALGFMELGGIDPALTGSSCNGILDLREALRWVRDNIAAFGGDPGKVSIMGQSAGGMNVLSLAAMPSARPLFHQAACQSGGELVFHALDEATPTARDVLAAAGLEATDVRGLAALPARALLAAQERAAAISRIGSPWRPTVGNSAMPHAPNQAARRGDTRALSVVIGNTRDERYDRAADAQPFSPRSANHLDLAAMQALEPRYASLLPQVPLADRHMRQLTAETFWIPSVRFAEAHSGAGGKVWMYRFDRGAPDGYARHGCDTPFVFGTRAIAHTPMPEDAAADLVRINAMWADWVKTGTLNWPGGPAWPRYDSRRRQTFIFDTTPRIERDPRGDERRLWDNML